MNLNQRSPASPRHGWPALLFAGCGGLALWVDLPVARWWSANPNFPGVKLFNLAEVFGHGLGVALILLTVWVLDPANRRHLPRLAAAAWGSGLAADGLKLLVQRHRPQAFDLTDLSRHGWDTFGACLTGGRGGFAWQGFPSAHMATAVGLAIALGWLYPRGRYLFPFFALLVAGQRMSSQAHFLSDTIWGAAIALAVAPLALRVCRGQVASAPPASDLESRERMAA